MLERLEPASLLPQLQRANSFQGLSPILSTSLSPRMPPQTKSFRASLRRRVQIWNYLIVRELVQTPSGNDVSRIPSSRDLESLLRGCSPQSIYAPHFQGELQVGYERGESVVSPMPPECKENANDLRLRGDVRIMKTRIGVW